MIGIGGESTTRRSHAGLAAGISRCAALADDEEVLAARNPSVSGWSVGEHVDHLVLAERALLEWIERVIDDPSRSSPAGTPTRTGRLVLVSGWIPRGRAKAPGPTVPDSPDISLLPGRLSDLARLSERLEPRLSDVHTSRTTTEHPILGHFTPAQWLRFLDVHHRHHEKIIRDIRTR